MKHVRALTAFIHTVVRRSLEDGDIQVSPNTYNDSEFSVTVNGEEYVVRLTRPSDVVIDRETAEVLSEAAQEALDFHDHNLQNDDDEDSAFRLEDMARITEASLVLTEKLDTPDRR